MVLETILQGILQRQFGKYLQNFDKQQINVGIWKGNIELRNMEVNRNIVNNLDLPVKIRFGLLNKLQMNVPWTQLSTQPVIINLDGLYILLESETKKNWKPVRTASLQEKESILNAFTESFLKDLEGESSEQNKNQGYIQRLSMRVVDNLQIKVRNIHIRYQDTQFSMEPFAFGITLKALDLQTTNQKWEQEFFDRTIETNKSIPLRKRLKLTDFAIYLQEEPHRLFIKEGSVDEPDFTQRVSEELRLLIPEESPDIKRVLGNGRIDLQRFCLIRPINLESKLTALQRALEPGEARMYAELTIKEIQVYMRKKQFVHLAHLVDVADDFRDSCIITHHEKFRIFLPSKRLNDPSYTGDRHKLVKSWWQFAGRSMLANIRYRKGNYRAFEMSQARFMLLQKDFSALYYKKLKKKEKKNLSKEDQTQLERIIYVVSMDILQDWTKKISKVYYEDQQLKKDRLQGVKDFFSGFGGLFSKKPKEEPKESEEEETKAQDQENIDKILTELGDQELYASHFIKSSDIGFKADFCLEEASLILEIEKKGNPFDGKNSEGVRVSLGRSILQATQLENKKLDIGFQLRDFGVELFSVQKSSHERDSIVYKQSQSIQNIFELHYRQTPSKDMEFEITLFPLTLVIQQLLVQRIVSYFKVPNLQFSDQAYDQLKTFKVGTQDKVQDTFYGKNNKLVLKIMSPNLLVPFQRNRDMNSPTWCINLGDIVLTNVSNLIKVSDSLDPKYYEPFNLSIEKFCLTYYQTMKIARAFSHLKSFSLAVSDKNPSSVAIQNGVDVICPFSLNLLVGLRKKKINDHKLAKIQILGQLSEVNNQVTPQLFNDFVNIDECFKIDEDENWEQLMSSKNEIIRLAKKISSIKRRTYFTWINTFAVMSGGYIYFYDSQKDVAHSSYFFLRECTVERKKTASADEFQFVLSLSNKYNDECELAFKARNEIDIWENIINQQVVEMSPNKQRRLHAEQQKEREIEQFDFDTTLVNFSFEAPAIQLDIREANLDDWVRLDLGKFESNVLVKEGKFNFHFQLSWVLLEAYNNVRYPEILASQKLQIGNKPILDFNLKHLSKNAPSYKDVDFQIDVAVGTAHTNFNPHQIHQLIVYITNIEVNKLRYHRAESLMPKDKEPSMVRESLLEQIARIKLEEKDQQNQPFALTFEVQVSFQHVSMLALNPFYSSPFMQLEVGATKFEYYRRRDHELVIGKFGNLQLIDKSCWPNTIDPRDYAEGEEDDASEESEERKEIELVGPRIIEGQEDRGGVIEFELKIMKNMCPDKQVGIKNVCKVEMHSFQVIYFQELTFRFMDYFFDQFLEAITTQPVTDKEKDVKHKMTPTEKRILQKLISKEGGYKEVLDLQNEQRTSVSVVIHHPLIILKPRPWSTQALEFDLGTIKIENQTAPIKGRWSHDMNAKIACQFYHIDAQQMFVKWSEEEQPISEPISMHVTYETVVWHPFVANNIPYTILDQASRFDVNYSPVLLNLEQTQFTFFMLCVDLNINYEDQMKELYPFSLIQQNQDIANQIKMRVILNSPSLSLRLFKRQRQEIQNVVIDYQMPPEPIAELTLIGFDLNFVKEMGGKADISIDLRTLFLLFQEKTIPLTSRELEFQSERGPLRRLLCGPLKSPIYVRTNKEFYTKLPKLSKKQIAIHIVRQPNGDKVVQENVQKLKIFLIPHVFISVFDFFLNGLPVYTESSRDLPNQFDPDLQNSPKMVVNTNIQDSLVCANQEISPYAKTIAFEGDIILYYGRQTVRKVKENLQEQYRHSYPNGYEENKSGEHLNFDDPNAPELSQIIYQLKFHVLNLSSFVCNMADLNGENFKTIKKRRIIHPFPVFFNSKEMLCLTPTGSFKAYNKKEIDLEKTIIKLSYVDFITLYRVIFYNLNQMKMQFDAGGQTVIQEDEMPDIYDAEIDAQSVASSSQYRSLKDTNLRDQLYTLKTAQNLLNRFKDKVEQRIEIFKPMIKPNLDKIASHHSRSMRRTGKPMPQVLEEDQDQDRDHSEELVLRPKTSPKRHVSSSMQSLEDEGDQQAHLMMRPYSLKKSHRKGTDFSGEYHGSLKKTTLLDIKQTEELQSFQRDAGRNQSVDALGDKPKIEFERLDDQFELVTHKLQLIIVNDHDNEFCPVLEINFSEFQYIFEESTGSHTKLSFQSYYYNPQYSLWEPFIENMVLEFIMISNKGESTFQVRSIDSVNINISEMLCENLINAKESWDKTYERFVEEIELQKMDGSQRPRLESRLSIQSEDKHYGDDVHMEGYHQEGDQKYRFPSMYDSSAAAGMQSGFKTDHESLRNNEDTVSPYTIENYSGFQIFVQKTIGERQSVGEGIMNLQKYIVENGDALQIEIDYEQRIAGELWREEYDPLTKSANEDAVRIVISDSERTYYPIEKVSFGSIGFFTHNLKTGRSYIPFGLYEFLIYEVTLRKMRKIIRLRTPYMFINKTDFNYLVRFSKNPQPCSFWVRKLAPGQMMPIPIQDIACFISIAIQQLEINGNRQSTVLSMQQPSSSRFQQIEWSADFQMADFTNVRNDAYLSLQHGERFTYINKQVQHSMAVDFMIVAPILIYNALPCTLNLAIPREDTESCNLKTGQHRYINSYSFGERIPLMMTIDGFDWGQYVIQANDKPRTGQDIRLKLKQIRERSNDKDSGQSLNLYLRVLSGGAGKRFVVYARTVILNKTDQSLTFYYNKHTRNKMAKVAGQNVPSRRNMVLISDRQKLRACLHNDFSDMFTIAGSGVQGEFAIRTQQGLHERFYQFSFKTSISLIMENEYIYSKVVTIAPKYVLINLISEPIQIVQSDYFQFVQEMAPNERKPFYWFSKRADKLIRAREVQKPDDQELKEEDNAWKQDWAFSNPFLLQQLGIISVTNRHTIHRNAVRFLRIERRMIEETIYIMIDRESEEHPVFRFENHCMGMSILYKQKGAESCDHLGIRESALFAWQDLTQPQPLLEVCFLIGNINERPVFVDGTKIELNLNILDTNTTISIPTNQLQAGRKVLVNITTDGHTRIVKFYEITEENNQITGANDKVQKVKQSFQVDMRDIGLSFVMKTPNNRRIELGFVNIVDLRGILVDTTDNMRNMQFRIGYLQIDNMGALKNVYPVLVKPKYLEKLEDGRGYKKPFLDISTDINLQNNKVRHFDRIECLLQTIAIKIEDQFLNFFFQFVTTVFKQLNSTFTKVNPLFKPKGLLPASSSRLGSRMSSFQDMQDALPAQFTPWKTVSTVRQAKMIYIAKLSVSPLDLQISFLSRSSITKTEKQALSSISQAFGVTVKNFQSANIRLNHIESDHVFGSSGDIMEQVFSLYKQRFLRNIFYIIGSIDILGNPINLFSSLGTGVKDFFFKPAQGFVKGPLEGGYGLLKGTSSLMKHSVQGAFGMSSKITSTMSKVLLTLMNDKDFISVRERKEITEKPKHVVDGVGYGLKSVFQSVGSGVVGIVAEPVKGVKKSGAKGFFTGTLKGIGGVFAKSAIGVLDLVSKTSQGIKNTAGILDRKSEDRRVRHPRCFYGSGDIIRPYEQNDSLVKVFLDRVKKGLFLQDHFLESYMYEVKHKLFMLLMTTEHVALIDTNQINVVWNIRSSSMMLVEKHRNGLKIFLKVRENRENSVAMEMDPNDKNGINYLHSRLTILIHEDI